MSVPAWFDMNVYVQNKLALQKESNPEYTLDQLYADFEAAGFPKTAEGFYDHFVQYGNAENVSPSNSFDVNYYFEQKAAREGKTVEQVKADFEEAGLSAWDHFTQYGMAEGLNPYDGFDTNAYLAAKASHDGKGIADVIADFVNAGLNPVAHYLAYGKDESLSYTPEQPALPSGLTLQQAFEAVQAGQDLPEGYTLLDGAVDLGAGSVASMKAEIKSADAIVSGAANKADITKNYTYSLEDGEAALTGAGDVLKNATQVVVKDSVSALNDGIDAAIENAANYAGFVVYDTADELVTMSYKLVTDSHRQGVILKADKDTSASADDVAEVLGSDYITGVQFEGTFAEAVKWDFDTTLPLTYALNDTAVPSLALENVKISGIDAAKADAKAIFDAAVWTAGSYSWDDVKVTYSLMDTVAAFQGASNEIISSATTATLKDTAANLEAVVSSGSTTLAKDGFVVEDSAANLNALDADAMDNLFASGANSGAAAVYLTNTIDFNLDADVVSTVDKSHNSGGHFVLADVDDTLTVTLLSSTQAVDITAKDVFTYQDSGDSANYSFVFEGSSSKDTLDLSSFDYNSATIKLGKGEDAITLGDGADTVVLGSGLTTASDMTGASAVTITSFAAADDQIEFDGYLGTTFDFTTAQALASDGQVKNASFETYNDQVIWVTGASDGFSSADGILSLFSNDIVSTAGFECLVVAEGSGGNVFVYYVQEDGKTNGISASEVEHIATLSGVGIDDITKADFGSFEA